MTTFEKRTDLPEAPPDNDGVPSEATEPRTVEVLHIAGAWQVRVPDDGGPISFETLAEAQRIGRHWAVENPPSELIVRDAYHRVVIRKTFPGG